MAVRETISLAEEWYDYNRVKVSSTLENLKIICALNI